MSILDSITISPKRFNEILFAVGVSSKKTPDGKSIGISLEDLEFTEDEIKDYIIQAAMRDYYAFFPKTEQVDYQINNAFSIDFPSEDVFGVTNIQINTAGVTSGVSSNPFYNNYLLYRNGSMRENYYGTTNDYGLSSAKILENASRQSFINAQRGLKTNIDLEARNVSGYSIATGTLTITWALVDGDFDSIPLNRISEVIQLSQAYLLRALGELRAQQNTDIANTFNFDAFLDRADKLEEAVKEKWKNFSKVVIIRG